jgi:ribosomal protein S18 acetylase RimI-like enzyme
VAEASHTTVVEASVEPLDLFVPLLDEVGAWLWKKGVKQWASGTFQGDRDRLRHLVEKGCLLLAYQGQRLAGGCILTEVDPGWPTPSAEAMYLCSLAVARFAAGQGLGDRIVDGCLRAACKRGKSLIRLDCWDGNEFLKSFYRRLGFRMLEAVQEDDYFVRLFEMDVRAGGERDEQP